MPRQTGLFLRQLLWWQLRKLGKSRTKLMLYVKRRRLKYCVCCRVKSAVNDAMITSWCTRQCDVIIVIIIIIISSSSIVTTDSRRIIIGHVAPDGCAGSRACYVRRLISGLALMPISRSHCVGPCLAFCLQPYIQPRAQSAVTLCPSTSRLNALSQNPIKYFIRELD